jgi:hypothetical protein
MTDTPRTVDDLLDLWADTAAPSEAQLRHPSQWTRRVLRVIGSPWTVEEIAPGLWIACHDGIQRADPNKLSDLEAFRLVCLLADQSRAEAPGPRRADGRRFARGLCWAVPASLAIWALAIWLGGRLGGAW